ncbi:unnamed protein product [Closterium sp. NIES-54]
MEDQFTRRKLEPTDLYTSGSSSNSASTSTSSSNSSSASSSTSASSSSGGDGSNSGALSQGTSCRCYRVANRFCCMQLVVIRPPPSPPAQTTSSPLPLSSPPPPAATAAAAASVGADAGDSVTGTAGSLLGNSNGTNGTNSGGNGKNETLPVDVGVTGSNIRRRLKREFATDWFCDQSQPANSAAARNETLTDGPLTALPCGIYPFNDDPFDMIVKQSHYKQWGERPMEWLQERVGRAWFRPGSTYLQLLDGSSNNVAHFLGKVLQILLVNGAGKRGGEGELNSAISSSIHNCTQDRIAHATKQRRLAEVMKETPSSHNFLPQTTLHPPQNSSSSSSSPPSSPSLQNSTPSLPFIPHVDRFLLPRHFYFLRIVQSFGPEGLHASLLQHLLAAALLPDLTGDARTCGSGSESPGAGPGSASAAGSGVGGAAGAGLEGSGVATGGEEGRGGEREGAGGGGGMGEARERGNWERELIETLLNRSLLLDINTTSLAGGRVEFEHVWDKATDAQPLCFKNVVLPGNLAAILYPGGQEVQAAFLDRIDRWLGKGGLGGEEGGKAGEEGQRGEGEGKGEQARGGQGNEASGEGQVGKSGRGGWSVWERGKTRGGMSLDLKPAGNEKIRLLYLQRTASANQGRRALDHTSHVALVNLFSRLNFDVRAADLGRLGFKKQYLAVRSADVIVAVHGAALAPTCAFLRGVAPVVLLGNGTGISNSSSSSSTTATTAVTSSATISSSSSSTSMADSSLPLTSNIPLSQSPLPKPLPGAVVIEIVPFGTQPTLYQIMAVSSGATYIQHQCHAARTLPRDEEFKSLTARDCDRNARCKNYRVHERSVELSQLDLKEIGHALKLAREIAGKARGSVVEAAEGLRERVKEGLCRYGRKLLLAGFCHQGFVQSPLFGDDKEVCVFHRKCGHGTWPAPEEPLENG